RGGRDNITVVLAELVADAASRPFEEDEGDTEALVLPKCEPKPERKKRPTSPERAVARLAKSGERSASKSGERTVKASGERALKTSGERSLKASGERLKSSGERAPKPEMPAEGGA